MPKVLQGALDSSVSPASVVLCHPDDQLLYVSLDAAFARTSAS